VCAHGRDRGSLVIAHAEGTGEMLVDVGVDGEDGHAAVHQVAGEEGCHGRLATASLDDEGDLHVVRLLHVHRLE
jgi:hypothetical protein